ncbi:hypothetical protein WR25_00680 [Diploscapter pachys]|uniref:CYRIA/CYRIB Rac1 binding domain-containing protein n=1 Tax=Diploscapter pachys TaxID=2018661 RepID=A0A2A2JIX4_9BILA|nr:hypothetical protein WR25_00680 [Diploscapter pachys]
MPSNARSSDVSCLEMLRSILRVDGDKNYELVEIFLDFENAVPSAEEQQLYYIAEAVLQRGEDLIKDVTDYEMGGYSIRNSVRDDSDAEKVKEALPKLLPFIKRTIEYYEQKRRIEQLVPDLLWELTSGPLPLEEQLQSRQAIARQFARLIGFVFEFDSIRMARAQITNDFSVYRRWRNIVTNRVKDDEACVPEGINIAEFQMFLGEMNPMLNALRHGIELFVEKHSSMPIQNTTDSLITLINVCRFMLTSEMSLVRLSPATRIFSTRVLVGLVILYDHIAAEGAFCSKTPVDLRDVVRLVKLHTESPTTEALLAGLKYTTKHYLDPTTPKWVRNILDDKH